MSDKRLTQMNNKVPSLDRYGIRRIIQIIVGIILMGAALFGSAGRLNWPAAWIYIGLYFATFMVMGICFIRKDPEMINERGRMSADTKGWDKVILAIYTPLLFTGFVIAGLDAGRFGWSAMSFIVQIIGFVILIEGAIIAYWAMANNTYLSTTVRIQEERGHQTVTSGPYQYVRHPLYVGSILMSLATPLLLGSWWALIPGGLMGALIILRTVLEDHTLQEELPGYVEYTGRVRYRLLPGVW